MSEKLMLNKPWLVAVWPGMGHVAISAGYYLMSKLEMNLLAEFSSQNLFEVEHVEVEQGLIQPARLPRSRFFVWKDPQEKRDIVVFIGEAQPQSGKYKFCQGLIEFANKLGVERVFTFAAMGTQMSPEQPSRVFTVATSEEQLAELHDFNAVTAEDGHIGGLNGVLLAAAAENGLSGASLLGEMPQVFAQLPYPKAALAVLETFSQLSGVEVDLAELEEQSRLVDEQLVELMARVDEAWEQQQGEEENLYGASLAQQDQLPPEETRRVDRLFDLAGNDRSRASDLKAELDRLGVFKEYEDRFLDLFKKPAA